MATIVVGVGNPDRGDDAVGRLVARQLEAEALPGVTVLEHGGDVADLVEILRTADRAVLVDAAVAGGEPGEVHRIDVSSRELPPGWFACSTHGLGLAEAVELARALGCLPRRCIVYAIEAQGFDPGDPPSPELLEAVRQVRRRIADELRREARDAPCNA